MNSFLKMVGAVACFMDAFDDAKIPRFKASSADNYENEDTHNGTDGTSHYRFCRDDIDRDYSHHSEEGDDFCNCNEDTDDSTVEAAVSAARIGRVLRIVDAGRHIAACRR